MISEPYYVASPYPGEFSGYNTMQNASGGDEYILAEGYLLKYDKRGGRPQIQPGQEYF